MCLFFSYLCAPNYTFTITYENYKNILQIITIHNIDIHHPRCYNKPLPSVILF